MNAKIKKIKWKEYQKGIEKIAKYVKSVPFKPDLIVGIARGGLVMTSHLSHILNCRKVGILFIDKTKNDKIFGIKDEKADLYGSYVPTEYLNRVLLVDDIVGYGTTFKTASEYLISLNRNIKFLKISLCLNIERLKDKCINSKDIVDYYVWKTNKDTWLVFPWEQ